jgi:hypothetical protein
MLARERGLVGVPDAAARMGIAVLSESATRDEADPLSRLVAEVAFFLADRRAHGR